MWPLSAPAPYPHVTAMSPRSGVSSQQSAAERLKVSLCRLSTCVVPCQLLVAPGPDASSVFSDPSMYLATGRNTPSHQLDWPCARVCTRDLVLAPSGYSRAVSSWNAHTHHFKCPVPTHSWLSELERVPSFCKMPIATASFLDVLSLFLSSHQLLFEHVLHFNS